MAFVIIMEASLSFLGLGVQPPAASWGGMVADGREFLADALVGQHVSRVGDPGASCWRSTSASQGLREAFDPRLHR